MLVDLQRSNRAGAVPPANAREVTAPRLNPFAERLGGGKPQLLQQMELMMKSWDAPDPTADSNAGSSDCAEEVLHRKIFKLEGCRSVLALFTSGSGCFGPILSKLFVYLFDLLESLLQQAHLQLPAPSTRKDGPGPASQGGDPSPPAQGSEALSIGEAKQVDFAFGKVRQMESEMRALILQSEKSNSAFQTEINRLASEKQKLEELIEFQASRYRKQRGEPTSVEEMRLRTQETITVLDLELKVHRLKQQLAEAESGRSALALRLREAESLNGKYALQAVQIAARVKVYHEHNERFATLLSMQYDERSATERENELLRGELMDLNKFHQLRKNLEGDSGTVAETTERRAIRYGFGNHAGVPRHLHFTGLMNRIALPKEAAASIVADLLAARSNQGRRSDFPGFIHNYLTKKHGADAIAWAYNLDEACQLHDCDPNLHLFWQVSRRVVGEDLYGELQTDVQIFLEACEIVDQMQHGELKLTVPVAHVFGILNELYPSYTDGALRRLMEQLQTTLTTNAHAHYRLLFPNLERDEVTDFSTFSSVDIRRENGFSSTFKELVIDDAVVTMQLLEDSILHAPGDRVTLSEITSAVLSAFDNAELADRVGGVVRRIVREEMRNRRLEMNVPKDSVVAAIRSKLVLRRGVYRSTAQAKGVVREHTSSPLGDLGAVAGDELLKVDYREVIQRTVTRRKEQLAADRDSEESDSGRSSVALTQDSADPKMQH